MPAALAALGAVSSVLGIYSFFDDSNDRILDTLADAQNSLRTLENLAQADFRQGIADGASAATTALNTLRAYTDGDSATDRESLAATAVENANSALNSVIAQTNAILNSASIETLAYAFGTLQYAIVVRQTVANVIEDGPLGSPGLHQQIKQAAALLYDTDFRDDVPQFEEGLAAIIEARVPDGITQSFSNVFTPLAAPAIRIITSSENTEHSQLNTVAMRGEISLTRFFPSETSEQFAARVNAQAAKVYQDVIAKDVVDLGIPELKEIAAAAHKYLSHSLGNEHNYEDIGGSGNDVFIGTSRSDYLSGRQGDDDLWGGRENVSGGSDGPDALSGGAGNDILRGGDQNDVLRGGSGNDIIIADDEIGQMGTNDVARFEGLFTDYNVAGGTTYATVTSRIDGSRDKVFGVEFLRFDDGVQTLGAGSALDDAGEVEDFVTAETIALLYEAALNRDGNIDSPGLNFYIDVAEQLEAEQGLDQNGVIEFIAEDLMTSPEFTDSFGDVNTLSNEAFLQRVYENVLDRTPDREGYDFYLQYLDLNPGDDGYITKEFALADIAISPENTQGSTDVLMRLYETTTPELHSTTGILLDWYFVA